MARLVLKNLPIKDLRRRLLLEASVLDNASKDALFGLINALIARREPPAYGPLAVQHFRLLNECKGLAETVRWAARNLSDDRRDDLLDCHRGVKVCQTLIRRIVRVWIRPADDSAS
jgi:hypothetical protein